LPALAVIRNHLLQQVEHSLHNYLSMQRFLDKTLRAEIQIRPEEVDAYLRAHPKDFIRPPWAYFFLVSGADTKDVAECAKDLDEMGDPVKVQERHPDVVIRTVSMDIPRLDPIFGGAIGKLFPGDLPPVLTINGEYHQVLLFESLPERQADPKEAYRQIEEILTTQKIHAAYNAWELNRLKKADIKVSKQILPHLRRGDPAHGEAGFPSL
jgi:hypothetical protein